MESPTGCEKLPRMDMDESCECFNIICNGKKVNLKNTFNPRFLNKILDNITKKLISDQIKINASGNSQIIANTVWGILR